MKGHLHLLILLLALWAMAASLVSCSDSKTASSDMNALLDTLANGTDATKDDLHWKGDEISSEARAIGIKMMEPFKASSKEDRLKVQKEFRSGAYTLLVIEPSWKNPTNPTNYLPLLVRADGDKKKVAGLMLPFNDIMPLIPESESSDYQSLSME